MNRMKRLFTVCTAALLLLLSAAFTVYAEEFTPVEDEAMIENATTLVYDVMGEIQALSPEDLDGVIQMYSQNGYAEAVTGFTQWKELSPSLGELSEVNDTEVFITENNKFQVKALLKFTNADVAAMFFLGSGGNIENLSFEKVSAAESIGLGAKLKDATTNLIVGMGTVFAVLIFLCGVIYLFGYISKAEKAIADKKTAKAAEAQPVSEPEPEVTAVSPQPSSDEELQAVIAAAIAAYEADSGSVIKKQASLSNGINIKTYRRK